MFGKGTFADFKKSLIAPTPKKPEIRWNSNGYALEIQNDFEDFPTDPTFDFFQKSKLNKIFNLLIPNRNSIKL